MNRSATALDRLYRRMRPLLFRLEAEHAHALVGYSWSALARLPGASVATRGLRYADPLLHTRVAGLGFANPLGLAGGFDKDGRMTHSLAALGFGFLELGTVTPRPQAGNPRPRLFRLPEDAALINRMGFNNAGAAALAQRLRHARRLVPLGVNIGKQRETPPGEAVQDYLACFRMLAPHADYIVVNISSPNTPGLRDLGRSAVLGEILVRLQDERARMQRSLPLFVKLSPDESPAGLDAALAVILEHHADGVVACNTSVARPPAVVGKSRNEAGGLSGRPLRTRSSEVVRYLYQATSGALPIVGVGGIEDAASTYEKILAGASLVQLYTALVYQGPGVVGNILCGLAALLRRDDWSSVEQAVGQGG